jgi:4-amino-4-deoxy-L-arabinose transferase-like glycosyltransferase
MPVYLRYIFIALGASLLFFAFLGQVNLFDWDEINFAECAREMIVSKDYLRAQIDFMPFWEKPPFFIWLQVLSMKIFGVNEYAARFPNAFFGVITLVTIYYAGKRLINDRMATWWVLLYAASWLPHFYFKAGIIDPVFNYFIFLAFFQFHLMRFGGRQVLHGFLSGLCLGLAILTKGPVALLVAGISFLVYIVVNRGLHGYKLKHLFIVAFAMLIPVCLWLGATAYKFGADYGKWFLNEFITYQIRLFSTEDADHGGPFFYHFIVLLAGCFPASVFLFQYTDKRVTENAPAQDFTRWMWILFWVVLIIFSIVKTKIVHYSSLCYFPLTYLAAIQVYRLSGVPNKFKAWVRAIMLVIGTIIAAAITLLPIVAIRKNELVPYIDDVFFVNNLNANVAWSYSECAWGIVYLVGIWVAVFWMKKSFRQGALLLCCVQILMIQAAILHFTPKVEAYSQRAAIDYFKGFADKDVYVHSLGYKSYANLFYAKKRPATNPNYRSMRLDKEGNPVQPEANEQWLLKGKVDKAVFFICKIQDKEKYGKAKRMEITGEKNGFVFLRRNDTLAKVDSLLVRP